MKKILFVLTIIIIVILLIIAYIFITNIKTLPPLITTPTPSPVPTKSASPYNEAETKRMFEIVTKRPTPAVQNDTRIREEIIESLNNRSGTLLESDSLFLKYIKGPNEFEAQIKTISVEAAKNAAVIYFREKGMTNDGICKLPLVFYPTFEVQQQLRSENIEFSPLPDFCL